MMKLFVVGEDMPNPDKWSMWSEPTLVIAENEEQALKVASQSGPVCEIPMDKPLYLMKQTEPAWGDDL